jgi:hypothetical protein
LRAARGDAPERLRELRIAHPCSNRKRLSGGIEIETTRLGTALQPLLLEQMSVESRGQNEALFGQLDGGLEQPRPEQPALVEMRRLGHAQEARHPDRKTADSGIKEGQRLAGGSTKRSDVAAAGVSRRS